MTAENKSGAGIAPHPPAGRSLLSRGRRVGEGERRAPRTIRAISIAATGSGAGCRLRIRPYARLARLDRPIGTWLLLFPGWWGIALASPHWPHPALLALFALGAIVMRGAGCTLNDIADRHYDAKVARTRLRPLPSGAVSVPRAVAFLLLQLALGAAVLLSLNRASILLGIAVLGLIGTYPFMKRITYWPQVFLGLNFNWGALIGWTAVVGAIGRPALLLYLGGVFWTIGYDTIYAHQDKADDALIGVKSSALALGEHTRPWLFVFYAAAVLLWGMAAGPPGSAAVLGRARRRGIAALLAGHPGRYRSASRLPR